VWSTHDFHHLRPYATLETARSERLAEVLRIGNPAQSQRCTVCHAPFQTVRAGQLSQTARISEGVSCENCHGPAENWLRAHTRPDWSHEDRVHAGMREIVETIARVPDAEAPALMSELGTDGARHALSALIVDERPLSEETVVIQQFRRRLERTRLSGRLRSVSQGVAEVQQKASSAVPMDATIVAELQQQGAVLHELVGGPAPSLNVPAVESSPDPGGPQGVHTNE